MFTSSFGHWFAFFTKRAIFRMIGRYGQVKQGFYFIVGNTEVCRSATAVDEKTNAYDIAAALVNNINYFANGTTGGYNIFDDKNASAWFDAETATQCHEIGRASCRERV